VCGMLAPCNVSSKAVNWTACLGAVGTFRLSAGERWRRRGATNAVSMHRCVRKGLYFRPFERIHGKRQPAGNASPFRLGWRCVEGFLDWM
jgi:hypothetical protein